MWTERICCARLSYESQFIVCDEHFSFSCLFQRSVSLLMQCKKHRWKLPYVCDHVSNKHTSDEVGIFESAYWEAPKINRPSIIYCPSATASITINKLRIRKETWKQVDKRVWAEGVLCNKLCSRLHPYCVAMPFVTCPRGMNAETTNYKWCKGCNKLP